MSKTNTNIFLTVAAGVFLLLGIWNASTANAETVRTSKTARVMKRPGERSSVVTRVDPGTEMKVLDRTGRWVKVRVDGRTGWVTRTSLAAPDRQARTVSKTRRRAFVDGRSTRRGGIAGAPEDRVGADAIEEEEIIEEDEAPRRARARRADDEVAILEDEELDDGGFEDEIEEDRAEPAKRVVMVTAAKSELRSRPSKKSRRVMRVKEGEELFFVRESESGNWMLVEDSGGEAGWIRSSEVGNSGFNYPASTKFANARLGYASLSSEFRSNGAGELANYDTSAAAASVGIGGEYIYRYSPTYLIRVDGSYLGARSSPGIRFTNAAGMSSDIAFISHEVAAGAALGYNFQNERGIAAYARAGYHYGKLDISDGSDIAVNTAYLPSEILSGITVGALVDVPRLTNKIGARIGLDLLYPNGKLQQTQGLEDGTSSDVTAAWGTALLVYQWKPAWDITGGYRYGYSKVDFEGASMRPHAATEADRKNVSHTLSLGVGKSF